MMVKPGAVVAFGLGYLLGARAGRERYDAIMRQVRSLRERPEVQSVAGVVSAQASGLGRRVRGLAGGGDGSGRSPGLGLNSHGGSRSVSAP